MDHEDRPAVEQPQPPVLASPSLVQLRRLLRWSAVALLLALPAGLMPSSWMNAVHRLLLGEPIPQQRIFFYLARSICGLYASLGVVTWVASGDIRRYLPLILVKSMAGLVFAAGILTLNVSIGMPWYWTLIEGAGIAVICSATLFFALRVDRSPDNGNAGSIA